MRVSDIEQKLRTYLSRSDSCIAVACSGGGDSMALALIAANYAKKNDLGIVALTVDHGLRKESAVEAKRVGQWMKKHRIPHHILEWKGKKPKSNIQEMARHARYQLLTEYCAKHGIKSLLVAHTLEDQAETFLLRLKRGSGVDGLSAMAPVTVMNGISIIRPLLETPKVDLLAYLKSKKQDYISDPSNENTAYDRIKIRKLMPQLAEIGLTPERLAKTARNMARAREFLQRETDHFLHHNCRIFSEGYAVLKILPDSDEIALRVLARLMMIIGGHEVAPRLSELERLYASIKSGAFKGATLGGCIFRKEQGILIFREPASVKEASSINKTVLWDNRFVISSRASLRTLSVSALTQEGWLAVARKYKINSPFPDKRILYTLPAIRDAKKKVIAVPHLGVGDAARYKVSFLKDK